MGPLNLNRGVILFSFVFLFSIQSNYTIALNKTGFTLELIHRDSINSPLYPGNLTNAERVRRMVQSTQSHLLSMQHSITGYREAAARPLLTHLELAYMVRVGIGNSPVTTIYLLLDTGSRLAWTQIDPCFPCFPQDDPKYKPSGSPTYFALPPQHPICQEWKYRQCTYTISYFDGAYTKGILVSDTFTFDSSNGDVESMPTVLFGVSNSSTPNIFNTGKIGGVLGMNRARESFATQMAARTGTNRFAYCMVEPFSPGYSYLRFGTDIVLQLNAQSTPFFKSSSVGRTYALYYVTLLDISINKQHLNLPPGTFNVRTDGSGGCFFDSGSEISSLVMPTYQAVKNYIVSFLGKAGLTRTDGHDVGLDLCYLWVSGFKDYPVMDLHFQGANFRLGPTSLFVVIKGKVCLFMVPMNEFTVIGAAQQQNHQIVYDIGRETLSFAAGNCAYG